MKDQTILNECYERVTKGFNLPASSDELVELSKKLFANHNMSEWAKFTAALAHVLQRQLWKETTGPEGKPYGDVDNFSRHHLGVNKSRMYHEVRSLRVYTIIVQEMKSLPQPTNLYQLEPLNDCTENQIKEYWQEACDKGTPTNLSVGDIVGKRPTYGVSKLSGGGVLKLYKQTLIMESNLTKGEAVTLKDIQVLKGLIEGALTPKKRTELADELLAYKDRKTKLKSPKKKQNNNSKSEASTVETETNNTKDSQSVANKDTTEAVDTAQRKQPAIFQYYTREPDHNRAVIIFTNSTVADLYNAKIRSLGWSVHKTDPLGVHSGYTWSFAAASEEAFLVIEKQLEGI